jgi:hypothetical protein
MASPSDAANVQADEPLIALMYDHDGHGGYYAQARIDVMQIAVRLGPETFNKRLETARSQA